MSRPTVPDRCNTLDHPTHFAETGPGCAAPRSAGADARLQSRSPSSLPVFGSLPRRDQGQWGEGYLRGLMLDGRRKSVQPMAERLPNGNMQALRQFVNESPWDWLPVRRRVAEQLCEVIRSEEWAADHHRRRRAGTPDEVGHASKTCVALGLLDRLAA
ncbi:transposase [Streptomyces olivaceoviridis]